MQNVIMKRGLRAHEKERYMRVDMLNSDRYRDITPLNSCAVTLSSCATYTNLMISVGRIRIMYNTQPHRCI